MDNEDGKHVVIVDGQRASKTFESKAEAEAEADKHRKRVHEAQGSTAKPVTVAVKQNLNG